LDAQTKILNFIQRFASTRIIENSNLIFFIFCKKNRSHHLYNLYRRSNPSRGYNIYTFKTGCLQDKYGKKKKRLPQVICIGAKKCGTGAFQNFLAHHPHLHKPPGYDEVHFFDNDNEYSKGIEYYHELMPETAGGEITYEKTPKYMVIPQVPERIYSMNSTVKLIAIVCNPVNRAFSDYTHVVKSNYFKNVSYREITGR